MHIHTWTLRFEDGCTFDRAQRVLREVQMFQPPSKRRQHVGVEDVGFSVSCHHVIVKIFPWTTTKTGGIVIPATIVSYAGHFSPSLLDGLRRHHRKSERLFKIIKQLPKIVLKFRYQCSSGVWVSQVWIFTYCNASGISKHPDLKHPVIAGTL